MSYLACGNHYSKQYMCALYQGKEAQLRKVLKLGRSLFQRCALWVTRPLMPSILLLEPLSHRIPEHSLCSNQRACRALRMWSGHLHDLGVPCPLSPSPHRHSSGRTLAIVLRTQLSVTSQDTSDTSLSIQLPVKPGH